VTDVAERGEPQNAQVLRWPVEREQGHWNPVMASRAPMVKNPHPNDQRRITRNARGRRDTPAHARRSNAVRCSAGAGCG
jgi:hypothetical protein